MENIIDADFVVIGAYTYRAPPIAICGPVFRPRSRPAPKVVDIVVRRRVRRIKRPPPAFDAALASTPGERNRNNKPPPSGFLVEARDDGSR